MTALPPAVIVVPGPVVATLDSLHAAVRVPVVLVGGWAVSCRLRMGRATTRPTEDLDVLLPAAARPARRTLEAISAVQDDPEHPCRLQGLPVLVDLLAEGPAEPLTSVPLIAAEAAEDDDGLTLLIPPMAALLVRSAEDAFLSTVGPDAVSVPIRLPLAGALFAAKVANIALEYRAAGKRASDAEDALRLLLTFGTAALKHDLAMADEGELERLGQVAGAVGPTGVLAQARVSGFEPDAERVTMAWRDLVEWCSQAR